MNFLFDTILMVCLATVSCLDFKKEIKKGCTALTDKGTVDLTSVAKTDGTSAAFTYSNSGLGGGAFYWNPCQDTTLPSVATPCNGSGAVFEATSGGVPQCVTLSKTADASFTSKGDDLVLNYASPTAKAPSHITLKCSDSVTNAPFTEQQCADNPDDNCFTLTHTVCCPKSDDQGGLSGGSILLIIVLVLAVLYVVVGVLIMKFVKKAEGAELCPNFQFWKSLPYLVKDGFMFVIKCGKASTSSYSDI